MVKENRKPKKITPGYLRNATYRYLERFASSEDNLRRILREKIKRRLVKGGEAPEVTAEHEGWIEEVIVFCRENALINDELYALSRARSFIRSGNSRSRIIQKLKSKGVDGTLIDKVLAELGEEVENTDLLAAAGYVRRRRFGSFSTRPGRDDDRLQKELASMARAGFSYDLSRRVLEMDRQELEDLIYNVRAL